MIFLTTVNLITGIVMLYTTVRVIEGVIVLLYYTTAFFISGIFKGVIRDGEGVC